jgi:hypothetical protein
MKSLTSAAKFAGVQAIPADKTVESRVCPSPSSPEGCSPRARVAYSFLTALDWLINKLGATNERP